MARWRKEEQEYFVQLGQEQDYNVHAVLYVELLQKLQLVCEKQSQTKNRFMAIGPSQPFASYKKQAATTRRLESERRFADEQYERVLLDICEMETKLQLTHR